MANDIEMPYCRQCPSGQFDLRYSKQSRYMAICHAVECVLHPKFPDNKISESQFLTKANVGSAIFDPLYNCPHMVKLRNEGKITNSIDFLKK